MGLWTIIIHSYAEMGVGVVMNPTEVRGHPISRKCWSGFDGENPKSKAKTREARIRHWRRKVLHDKVALSEESKEIIYIYPCAHASKLRTK